MNNPLLFDSREAFRSWLAENCMESGGVWLLFGKKGGPKTLTANEALEEALCFGWIDGVMQSIDAHSYQKYFSRRISKSKWSAKNKQIAEGLIASGRMHEYGMLAIEEAKKNGSWDNASSRPVITQEQVEDLRRLLEGHEPACINFLHMSPSVQKNYAGLYLDAKSEKTRKTRLEKIIARLNQNLKPM